VTVAGRLARNASASSAGPEAAPRERPASAPADRHRAAPESLRPSRVPVSGAPPRTASGQRGTARPSSVPVRPVPVLPGGSGHPLAVPVREELEAYFGANFSQVRIHADHAARASADDLDARAYTFGEHIVVNGDATDRHVLAHELTHVVQQRQGPVVGIGHGGGVRVSASDDVYEQAADASAARFARPSAGPEPCAPGHPAATAAPRRPSDALAVQRMIKRPGGWEKEDEEKEDEDKPKASSHGQEYLERHQRESVSSDNALDAAVEEIIDNYLDPQDLFMQRADDLGGSTPRGWAEFLFSYIQERYDISDWNVGEVEASVKRLKGKRRYAVLHHMAFQVAYSYGDGPSSVQELRLALSNKGAFLDKDDDEAIQALFLTEGKFARLGMEIAANEFLMSDQDNIVVVLDSHQNKHQNDKIQQLPEYRGGRGAKFASSKGLQWHRDNTEPVVRQRIMQMIQEGKAKPGMIPYSPSKDPIGGIHYDLTISYDEETGKYLGTYHCNPEKSEK
jgi:hypothetical protein